MKRLVVAIVMAVSACTAGWSWAAVSASACQKPESEAQERICLESDLARVRSELKSLIAKIRREQGAPAAEVSPTIQQPVAQQRPAAASKGKSVKRVKVCTRDTRQPQGKQASRKDAGKAKASKNAKGVKCVWKPAPAEQAPRQETVYKSVPTPKTAKGFDIAAFDQSTREFDSYVRHECDAVRSHVKGSPTAALNASLACQINLISSRQGALEMMYRGH